MRLIPGLESKRRAPAARNRARMSRTFSRGRKMQYRSLLRLVLREGYTVVPLGRFLAEPSARAHERLLILRHDVDQRPVSALETAEVEQALAISSTWYFRWRTADPDVIAAVRAQGGEIGLHYETLTRRALREGLTAEDEVETLIESCRDELRSEIDAFAALFGPLAGIAAHGDTRVPGVRNVALVEGLGTEALGVGHDANISLREHRLGAWLTDRSAAAGSWSGDRAPEQLLSDGLSPILCLTHPNNWVSGPALWRDRALTAILPPRSPGEAARVRRSLPDTPPPRAQR